MKKINIFYWISTVLICGLMAFSAYPDLVSSPDAVKFFKMMGYPLYLLPFLGVAKFLGVIAVLVPGFNRLKEWAYAGLFFDLLGAFYSMLAIKTPFSQCWMFILFIGMLFVSYFLHHKRLEAKAA